MPPAASGLDAEVTSPLAVAEYLCSLGAAQQHRGGVAEWLKATVLKTVNVQAFVGSNPTPSVSFPCSLMFGEDVMAGWRSPAQPPLGLL